MIVRSLALFALLFAVACRDEPRNPGSTGGRGTQDTGISDAGRQDAGAFDLGVQPGRDGGGAGGAEDTNELCSDGVSNDNDRFVDCDDYDCTRTPGVTVCGGGQDAGSMSGAENTNQLCSDGVSNDGDQFVDCDDYDCSRSPSVTVCGTDPCTQCTNGATAGACATQFNACGRRVACQTLIQCTAACAANDSGCISSCRTMYPDALTEFDALMACIDTACASSCP